jgi:6-pyruvoyltetrahydropterin/6-carboxytetrahydropterin synthase
MFRLTREVRFAVNEVADQQLLTTPSNNYAGFPALTGFGSYVRVQVTLKGELDPKICYLRNIKEVDLAVRDRILKTVNPLTGAPQSYFRALSGEFRTGMLDEVTLWLSPFLSITQLASEIDMYTRLSQKFEFSASHRLHNQSLSEAENRQVYGKCNHPSGHGHNYELQVTLRGKPTQNGLLVNVPAFERIVKEVVIDKLDHKNLNVDVPEFQELIPTVENIAMTIHRMLKNRFTGIGADLASVTVWETPKTWCEYSE